MIIDAHAHIFPDKIAEKASVNIGNFYEMKMKCDGTSATLLKLDDLYGIDRSVVSSVATVPEQVEAINDFIFDQQKQHPDRFIGFASLHPKYNEVEKEVERIVGMGLYGVKLHPDFQRFSVDSPEMQRIYAATEGRLPILIHMGDNRTDFSKPDKMARMVEKFPKQKFICAHFGGWSEWEQASMCLAGMPIWVDSSSSLYALTPEKARKLIDRYGVDRVFFGTDYPMWNPKEELEQFNRIPLKEEERQKILYQNAADFFGL